ncbi:hypothetical protein M9H77_13552 [Catharanthus roseus]|uniref:Uncharacterized protein n=1 Tax=Catharanthus roseus TaxID=4058 RepID=A0ACC0BKN7_CATRO|nr:hypothetical protein M9H77_13552 [Catharanthus roseus]
MEVVSQGGCRRLFYTTAGEVDGLQDDVGWFQMMKQANGRPSADLNISWSSVEVSLEECRQLWEPWRRALIIKLLRKTVSLKPTGSSKGLGGGTWIVLGQYLIVAKWRPNFQLSKESISLDTITCQYGHKAFECPSTAVTGAAPPPGFFVPQPNLVEPLVRRSRPLHMELGWWSSQVDSDCQEVEGKVELPTVTNVQLMFRDLTRILEGWRM